MRSNQKYLKGIMSGMDTGQLRGMGLQGGRREAAEWMNIQTIFRLPSKSWLEGWLASLILVKLNQISCITCKDFY